MGADNRQRLIGKHETSSFDTFSFSLADRQCSLRIPTIPGFDKN